jgi:phosphotransferase system HPr (HPr) family protein
MSEFDTTMKTKHVVLASEPGITAAVATRLASAIKNMHSVVILKCGEQFACARNILSVLALCAAVGSTVEVQTFGEDEGLAAEMVEMILTDSGDTSAK